MTELLWYFSPVIDMAEHLSTTYIICGEKRSLLSSKKA